MICYCDTDILLKLTAFGLLEEALRALGVTDNTMVYVTPEAAAKCRSSLRRHSDFRREILDRTLQFISRVRTIQDVGDPDEREQLRFVDGIDVGERALFLATRNKPEFILLTGDKTALRTLTNEFLNTPLHDRHRNRVVCLEAAILYIVQRNGFDAVRTRLHEGATCDSAIRYALAAGRATESEFTRDLQAAISRLDFETQGLLISLAA